jgi:tetratricopeptide (TPR) repeat protein
MSFVRRKRGQVLLVHNERVPGTSRVRQREIHRFISPLEIEKVLTPSGWVGWTRGIAWREKAIEFDWPAIRERLRVELDRWRAEPSGATHRRNRKIERLASELVVELAPLSSAKTADAELIERVPPSLVALRDSIARLLAADRTSGARPTVKVKPKVKEEIHMSTFVSAPGSSAEQMFDEGMECWWGGDRHSAVKFFRRALAIDPQHADAHNHLGIVSLETRRLRTAEEHFRAAIDGGERHIARDGARVPWGILENRPYLRALGNLALVLRQQQKWGEALAIHRRMLELNPDDNQGVRWLVGMECLHLGDDQAAIEAFQRCADEEVGCAFGLALARLRVSGPTADIGEPLLTGFAANRYVTPMLLGEPWERLDGYHGTSMAEPEWADDVVAAQAGLWQAVPRGADLLRFWWSTPAVVSWRGQLDEIMVQLKDLPPSDERSALVGEWSTLRSEDTVRELVRAVRRLS